MRAAAQARRAAHAEARPLDLGRLPRGRALQRRGRRAQGALRPRRRPRAPGLGPRRQRRPLLARARRGDTCSPWTATNASSASSTRRCARRARADPAARRRPRRPLPALGLARPRAAPARGARPARPRALPRARPPPGDQRATSRSRSSSTWLRGLGARLVIEFADRDDPMVTRLLAAKRAETHEGYGREAFERALGDGFEVERREQLGSGTRTLYLARPRRELTRARLVAGRLCTCSSSGRSRSRSRCSTCSARTASSSPRAARPAGTRRSSRSCCCSSRPRSCSALEVADSAAGRPLGRARRLRRGARGALRAAGDPRRRRRGLAARRRRGRDRAGRGARALPARGRRPGWR